MPSQGTTLSAGGRPMSLIERSSEAAEAANRSACQRTRRIDRRRAQPERPTTHGAHDMIKSRTILAALAAGTFVIAGCSAGSTDYKKAAEDAINKSDEFE